MTLVTISVADRSSVPALVPATARRQERLLACAVGGCAAVLAAWRCRHRRSPHAADARRARRHNIQTSVTQDVTVEGAGPTWRRGEPG
jgi:hypothetical protein